MRLPSSEALVGLDHAGRDQSQGHTGIPPAFDVARDAANGAHHVLGDVGTGERSTKLLRQFQSDDSQDFVEAFDFDLTAVEADPSPRSAQRCARRVASRP